MPETLVWEEIVLPQPPPADDGIGGLLWLAGILLLGIIAIAGWYRQRRPAQRAQRAIKRLQKQIKNDPAHTREHLYQLRACLRDGLGTHRLSENAGNEAWRQYLEALTYHSFAPPTPSTETTLQLAQQALRWLEVRE